MTAIIIALFVIGYLAITLEHPLKIDKTVPALLMASLIWALLAIGFNLGWFSVIDGKENTFSILSGELSVQNDGFHAILTHHFAATAEILIFLIAFNFWLFIFICQSLLCSLFYNIIEQRFGILFLNSKALC